MGQLDIGCCYGILLAPCWGLQQLWKHDHLSLMVLESVQQTGVGVVNGALSTLIAALCLAGSGSYVFLTFFYSLLFIVLCGAFQGLVVLPVLLDLFQPAPHAEVFEDHAQPHTATATATTPDAKVPVARLPETP